MTKVSELSFYDINQLYNEELMSNNLSDILRGYVSKEKQKNPYLNETGISKKMDIPPTTFNRLVNGHSKPAVKTLLKQTDIWKEITYKAN